MRFPRGESAFLASSLFHLTIASNPLDTTISHPKDTTTPIGFTPEPKYCAQSCHRMLQSFKFADQSPTTPSSICGSRFGSLSYLGCVIIYCDISSKEVLQEVKQVNGTCRDGGNGKALGGWEAVKGVDMGKWEVIEGEEGWDGKVWEGEVMLGGGWVERMAGTLDAWEYVYSRHISYGWLLAYYWLTLILLALTPRLFSLLPISSFPPLTQINNIIQRFQHSRLANWYTKNITLPMTFGPKIGRQNTLGTVPPRGQGVVIGVFVVLNFWACLWGYRVFEGNIFYPFPTSQYLRYTSDRTGIISLANFPLIWLFGTRNNLVSFLTGWDFPACTQFHRWVGRVAVLEAVWHSVGYTWLVFREGGWERFWGWWTWLFWWAGEFATIFMCAIIATSIAWIRNHHYETFLLTHILLSLLSLLTTLLHVSIIPNTYDLLIWIPVSIFLLDRLLRTVRILAFNPRFWKRTALATYCPDANIIRLEVPMGESWYRMPEGAYCYLVVFQGGRFWESHPFTVAGVTDGEGFSIKEHPETGPLLRDGRLELDEPDSPVTPTLDTQERVAKFLIRPYDQFTARLRDLASENTSSTASLRVLVEGPYGTTHPLNTFETVIFIVGGSGIAIPLSYLPMLVPSSSKAYRVEIHWSVREGSFAKKVLERDLDKVVGDERFGVQLYMRHGGEEEVGVRDGVEVVRSRLCCRSVLEGVQRREGKGRMAVVSCGPGGMADEVRDGVRGLEGRVEYFEESYTW